MFFIFQKLPVYKDYVNCTYVFEWNTIIACGAVMGDWTASCIIKDRFLSYEYDLSLLYKKQQIHYVSLKCEWQLYSYLCPLCIKLSNLL